VVTLITAICILIGTGVIWLGYRSYRKDTREIESLSRWQKGVAEIIDTRIEVVRVHGSDGDTETGFMPLANYRFTVGGDEYTGSRVKYSGASFTTQPQASRWQAAHVPGTTVPVSYDPENPSDCALELDTVTRTRAKAILVLCVVAGFWFIYIGLSL
jgi:hypothetical protein